MQPTAARVRFVAATLAKYGKYADDIAQVKSLVTRLRPNIEDGVDQNDERQREREFVLGAAAEVMNKSTPGMIKAEGDRIAASNPLWSPAMVQAAAELEAENERVADLQDLSRIVTELSDRPGQGADSRPPRRRNRQ